MANGPAGAARGADAGLTPDARLILRLAFGSTFGFAIALAFDWEFSFLAPMLAVQVLAGSPTCPSFKQGLAIPLVIVIGTSGAFAASTVFSDSPAVLMMLVSLVVYLAFYARRRGAPPVAIMLFQLAICGVVMMSTISLDVADVFAEFLRKGSVAAIGTVWIAHALFPAPAAPDPGRSEAPAGPVALPPTYAARIALSDALVLMPFMYLIIIGSNVNNFVILTMVINILGDIEPGRGGRIAIGLVVGNALGGFVALVAQQFTALADAVVIFFPTVFVASVWFASRIVRGGDKAPLFALAFGTFILILGLAITPLPGGSEEMFILRIFNITLAGLYAVGALTLVAPLRRLPLGPGPRAAATP